MEKSLRDIICQVKVNGENANFQGIGSIVDMSSLSLFIEDIINSCAQYILHISRIKTAKVFSSASWDLDILEKVSSIAHGSLSQKLSILKQICDLNGIPIDLDSSYHNEKEVLKFAFSVVNEIAYLN